MAPSQDAARSGSTAGQGIDRRVLLAAAGFTVLGLVIYLVGLPTLFGRGTDAMVFDTELGDLSLPTALFVALAGTAVSAALLTRANWRVVDIVVASVLGVAGGLLFAVWNAGWEGVSKAVPPPASALLVGVWLLPAVLGGLVLRKPGAAVYTELVAAVLSALIGSVWGFSVVWYGIVEGLGAEAVFALLLYRKFGAVTATLAGIGAGVTTGLMDSLLYYPATSAGFKVTYVVFAVVSGGVIAGLGAWGLTRALARTGALAPLASGRVAERV